MTGPVPSPILSKPDFIELFRPLVGAEDKLADLLLRAASSRIRRRFAEADLALDETDDEVRLIVFEMVVEILRPGTYAGLSSYTTSTDDATETRVFANAVARLTLSEDQIDRLGLSPGPNYCFAADDY
jgi:hypothetical protein